MERTKMFENISATDLLGKLVSCKLKPRGHAGCTL